MLKLRATLALTFALLISMPAMAKRMNFISFLGDEAWSEWVYDGNETVHGDIELKEATVNGNAGQYMVVYSNGPATTDPKLWVYLNGWRSFHDDINYPSDLNFKCVIHFNGRAPYGIRLGYVHSSSNDRGSYKAIHKTYNYDPQHHNTYYLEVYADGNATLVWHN